MPDLPNRQRMNNYRAYTFVMGLLFAAALVLLFVGVYQIAADLAFVVCGMGVGALIVES